jgi:hypothetical protein
VGLLLGGDAAGRHAALVRPGVDVGGLARDGRRRGTTSAVERRDCGLLKGLTGGLSVRFVGDQVVVFGPSGSGAVRCGVLITTDPKGPCSPGGIDR